MLTHIQFWLSHRQQEALCILQKWLTKQELLSCRHESCMDVLCRIACTVHRCSSLLLMSHVAWSVSVCSAHNWCAVHERVSRSRRRLGSESSWSKEPCIRSDESIRSHGVTSRRCGLLPDYFEHLWLFLSGSVLAAVGVVCLSVCPLLCNAVCMSFCAWLPLTRWQKWVGTWRDVTRRQMLWT